MSDKVSYTLEEVQKHNTRESLWIVFDNKVYDVTAFLAEHPGGEKVLLENAGTIATEAFNTVNHSEDAIKLRETYFIGELADAPIAKPVVATTTTPATTSTNSCCCGGSCGKWVAVAGVAVGVIAVLAIVYRRYK